MLVSSLDSAITRGRSSWQCGIRSQVHDGIEPVLVDPVNPETDELIDRKILHPSRLQMGDEVRRCSMNPHGDEFVRFRGVTGLFKTADHFRRYTVNSEGDELVAVRKIQARR